MDLETLPGPMKPVRPPTMAVAIQAQREAVQAVLVAARRHQLAQAALKDRGGVRSVRVEAAAAHMALDTAAVAYGVAHAALVAAS